MLVLRGRVVCLSISVCMQELPLCTALALGAVLYGINCRTQLLAWQGTGQAPALLHPMVCCAPRGGRWQPARHCVGLFALTPRVC